MILTNEGSQSDISALEISAADWPRSFESSWWYTFILCRYSINRVKEATGRVVIWRQFGVARSYTLEASYCGTTRNCWRNKCDQQHEQKKESRFDPRGHQICPWILQGVGASLCKAFLLLDPSGRCISTNAIATDPLKSATSWLYKSSRNS